MEGELNGQFEKARDQGRKISYKWILRNAKEIYGRLHPNRVIQHEGKRRPTLVSSSLMASTEAFEFDSKSHFNAVQNELRNPLINFYQLSKTGSNTTAE